MDVANDHDPAPDDDRDRERESDIIDRHVNALMEHFDTVQVFVTKYVGIDESTIAHAQGKGNWHARIGQVREWVTRNDERTRADVRGEE